jgi:hypothetical protein
MITRCAVRSAPRDRILEDPALRRKTRRVTHRTITFYKRLRLWCIAELANVV